MLSLLTFGGLVALFLIFWAFSRRKTQPDGVTERVAMKDLKEVVIETNTSGPWGADVWWLLTGSSPDARCAYPGGATGEQSMLQWLQALPGFDDKSVSAGERIELIPGVPGGRHAGALPGQRGIHGKEAFLRQARREDITGMQRVRMAVRENRLTSSVITEADYVAAIEQHGRGWVVEEAGEIVGFAVGDARDGNIWALFVHPAHERRGHGRRLHDAMVSWLQSRGLARLWLTTDPATRAQRFYEAAGWRPDGDAKGGSMRYVLELK